MPAHAKQAYIPLNGKELAAAIIDDLRKALEADMAFSHNLAYPLVAYTVTVEVTFWPPIGNIQVNRVIGDDSARAGLDPEVRVITAIRPSVEIPDQVRQETDQSVAEAEPPQPSEVAAALKAPGNNESSAVRRLRIQKP